LKLEFELELHNKINKHDNKDIYITEMIKKVHQIYRKYIDIFEYSFNKNAQINN
jgi:hypothetical protein|tara:strand:- start:1449 stop:1610 length:162 start_codon:yes stop_codon:yes gene_type:complete